MTSFIRLSFGVLAIAASVGGSATAQTAQTASQATQPTLLATGEIDPPRIRAERPGQFTAGNYLAARHASMQKDSGAAADFYRSVLRVDRNNKDLVERAFLSFLVEGRIEEAAPYAERILRTDKNHRIAQLVVGVRALKQARYKVAQTHIDQSVRGPITDLAAALLNAWAARGDGNTTAAIAILDKLQGPASYALFKDLHAGMILENAGREKQAGVRLERAYKADDGMIRVVQDYARWLSRNRTNAEAVQVYEAFDKKLPRHPLILAELSDVNAKKKLPSLVNSPQAGAAEALYSIGASLSREGGAQDLGLVYLQLSLYLQPTHGLALLSLGDVYEALKKPELAIKAFERVPASSPLRRNAQTQMATNLDALDRSDEAIATLKRTAAEQPKDVEALLALGNIERSRKKFADCGETFTRAIEASEPDKVNWVMLYYRGICFERSKQWPKAEADMRKALELRPDEPNVLNYLGYSWIDQHINLDEGMKMIRKAVEKRPDDGYIVDSLGWAYYRIGNYEEAVKHLERAIDLRPEDPTINDHLGDAYWRVGRKLEAGFQWAHARDLKPEPEELPKIEAKLRDGLPDIVPATSASAEKDKKEGNGG